MNNGWSSDFSYGYYRELLKLISENFQLCLFHEAPQILNNQNRKPKIFLRHDIDIDLRAALIMAEIENELKIASCYMVMTNCPFYTLGDESSVSILLRIKELGHEIGLHFSSDNHQDSDSDGMIAAIDNSAQQLEDTISSQVHSISFHRPFHQIHRGPLFIAGRINAYSEELMDWYLSDSKGNWREGEPLSMLEKSQKEILQLLVHPIWWGRRHLPASDRLQSFFNYRTKGLSINQIKRLDDALSRHLTITRSGKQQLGHNGNNGRV